MNIMRLYFDSLIINYYPTTVNTSDEQIEKWIDKNTSKNKKSKE